VDAPAGEESRWADEEGVDPLAHKGCEGCIDLMAGGGVDDQDLQSHGAGSRLRVAQRALCACRVVRVDEDADALRRGHQVAQESQPLCRQLGIEKVDPCRVAARPGEAGD
jgi:hypothetical protein